MPSTRICYHTTLIRRNSRTYIQTSESKKKCFPPSTDRSVMNLRWDGMRLRTEVGDSHIQQCAPLKKNKSTFVIAHEKDMHTLYTSIHQSACTEYGALATSRWRNSHKSTTRTHSKSRPFSLAYVPFPDSAYISTSRHQARYTVAYSVAPPIFLFATSALKTKTLNERCWVCVCVP